MQSVRIDVVLWDEGTCIMASPVSKKGLMFLKEIRPVDQNPTDFGNSLPPGVVAVFFCDDGIVMPISANRGLQ